jgi:predicted DNA-binding transcriptional regulator AlpA
MNPTDPKSPEYLLNEQEVCDWLRISLFTARKWRLIGRGPAFRKLDGHLVRYRRAEVQAWLDGNTFVSTTRRAEPAAA